MKWIFLILLLVSFTANATTYYVSNAGSNAANGTTTGTSWATLSKISGVSANDSVLLKCGDTWNEKLPVTVAGLYIGSYSTGAKPLITGYQVLSGWANVGNIWSSTLSNTVRNQNTVYINGAIRVKGRFPNIGWLTFTSHVGKTQITGGLSGTPNYTGGELGIRVNHWVIDHHYITAQSGGTITITPGPFYALTDGYGYFIQNIESVLDVDNEWCIDTTTKVIKVYGSVQPTAKASVIDTLVFIYGKIGTKINGLQFSGANLTAIQITGSNNTNIANCDIYECGNNGISGEGSNFCTVSNCKINDCWNDGLIFFDFATGLTTCNNASVTDNIFNRIGTGAGMNKNLNQSSIALELYGDKSVITGNTIKNTGYIGVYFYGDSAFVKNNYVDTFCYVKDDGGGLYTFVGSGLVKRGGRILSNIVMNGLGNPSGTEGDNQLVFGIYLDDNSQHVTVDSNTVFNCTGSGFELHIGDSSNITNNTLVYNKTSQLKLLQLKNFGISDNLVITNNVMYSESDNTDGQPYVLDMANPQTTLALLGTVDSNFYSKPSNPTKIIKYKSSFLTITNMQDSGLEIHGRVTPINITAAAPILKINNTRLPIMYGLSGTFIDNRGIFYTNAVEVKPFQSILLYKSLTDIPQQNSILRLKYKK